MYNAQAFVIALHRRTGSMTPGDSCIKWLLRLSDPNQVSDTAVAFATVRDGVADAHVQNTDLANAVAFATVRDAVVETRVKSTDADMFVGHIAVADAMIKSKQDEINAMMGGRHIEASHTSAMSDQCTLKFKRPRLVAVRDACTQTGV